MLGVPVLVIIFALVAVVGWILLNRTTFGRRTLAVGGNPEAARLAGIRVQRQTMYLYILLGIACGIAAVMIMARTTTGTSTHGSLYELDAIAAVVIGGTLLSGGRGTIVGTVFGVLIFTTLTNVFTLNNLDTSTQAVAKGVIIVAAVLLQQRVARAAAPALTPSTTLEPTSEHTHHHTTTTSPARSQGDSMSAPLHVPPGSAPRRRRRPRPRGRRLHEQRARRRPTRIERARRRRQRQRRPRREGRHRLLRPGGRPRLARCRQQAPPRTRPEKYCDIEFKAAEGTNDASLQISQIETFINDKVDAIVLLPTDGAALTEVATKAMQAGIPVINVDREFSRPFAARTTVLGDNYGMGVCAGTYACKLIKDKKLSDPVIAEIAGIDSLPLTQDRSKGFADALKACNQTVDNRVAAEFTVESGEKEASNLLQAAPKIDVLWNHDDDQGVGVMAALDNANRHEMAFIGGAGSANAMRWIQEGKMEATVIYPPTQAADGVRLARLLAPETRACPTSSSRGARRVVLNAPVVTKENVEEYLPLGFES